MRYLFTYGIELLISKQYIDRWIGGQLQIRAKVEAMEDLLKLMYQKLDTLL